MRIPAKQIAYVRRFVSENSYTPSPGTPFRCYGWATTRSEDASAEAVPAAWVELYCPTRPEHAETGELLDPIDADDRIVLPVSGTWVPEVPAVPGSTTGGTAEVQRLRVIEYPYPPTFRLRYDGQLTTTLDADTLSTTSLAAALNALPNLDGVTVQSKDYQDWLVTFAALLGVDVPLLQVVPNFTPGPYGDVQASLYTAATPGTVAPPMPAVPGHYATAYVEHYVQGVRVDANNGLTNWAPGSVVQLLRV